MHKRTSGLLPRIRIWLVGEKDVVDQQLHQVAKQGTGPDWLGHASAFVLVTFFCLQSVVAFSGDTVGQLVTVWATDHRFDFVDVLNLATIAAIALCMDSGMLTAAAKVRGMRSRRASLNEIYLHLVVLVSVALVEAGTCAYMAWRTDHPGDWMAWSLIIVRSIIAPILTVYLSLSAPLPVGPKDILYQAEFASGRGVLRDVVTAANDHMAPLARKMELFRAAASMSPHDRGRLEQMIQVMQPHTASQVFGTTTATSRTADDVASGIDADQMLHSGAKGAERANEARLRLIEAPSSPAAELHEPMARSAGVPRKISRRSNVRTPTRIEDAHTTAASPRTNSGRSLHDTLDLRQRREIAAKQIMDSHPTIGTRDLARQISELTQEHCGFSTAQEIRRTFRARSQA